MEKALLVGLPVSWDNPVIPDDLRPDVVKAALQRAMEACPHVAGEKLHLECSEFPCMLWGTPSDGSSPLIGDNDPLEVLAKCPAWSYRRGLVSFRSVEQPDGERIEVSVGDVLNFAATSGELADSKRTDYRLKTKVYDALDAWVGDTGDP